VFREIISLPPVCLKFNKLSVCWLTVTSPEANSQFWPTWSQFDMFPFEK
jgi:hypothetical protein